MPARRVRDPLVNVTLKVPQSLRAELETQAAAAKATLSDILRSHLTLAAAKPLGKAARRRQPKRLASVSGVDDGLVRQVAAIGSNLNQIARAANAGALAGKPLQVVEVLALLRSIERQVGALVDQSTDALNLVQRPAKGFGDAY